MSVPNNAENIMLARASLVITYYRELDLLRRTR